MILIESAVLAVLTPFRDGIRLLDGAEVLFPAEVGSRLFALHDKKQIITAGSSVTMREAEAMRFVARATHISVQVSKAYVQAGNGCIFISWLED